VIGKGNGQQGTRNPASRDTKHHQTEKHRSSANRRREALLRAVSGPPSGASASGWPGREEGRRCPVWVDGVRCGYFSDPDELLLNPEENRARRERHRHHLRHGPCEVPPVRQDAGRHGNPGPGDPPRLDHPEPDNNYDLLNRVQAVSFALHRLGDMTWTLLRFPTERSGPLRLLLWALQHGCVPRDEWFAALEQFLPPDSLDWELH
jgi:hypothetical protein